MNPPNAPVVTIVSAITAAVTSTLGLLSFVGIDQDLIGALQLAAGGWIIVGAMLIHQRTTPTEHVALTVDEAEKLAGPGDPLLGHPSALRRDRGAVDLPTVLVVVLLVVLILVVADRL